MSGDQDPGEDPGGDRDHADRESGTDLKSALAAAWSHARLLPPQPPGASLVATGNRTQWVCLCPTCHLARASTPRALDCLNAIVEIPQRWRETGSLEGR